MVATESGTERTACSGIRAVRAARAEEVPALVALINEAYVVERHFVSGPRITEASAKDMVSRGEFIVLDKGRGQLVASARLHCAHRVGHLSLLSVRPNLQRRGIGQRMIAVAEALATASNARCMQLQVVHLRAELATFYTSLGYRPVGTSTFDETKTPLQPVHFIEMVKDLG